jgi:predicted metal-dependent hydrolase
MMMFAKALSPELPGKLRPILLKCDVEVNNRLLEFIETLQLQVSALEFRNEEQERDFLAEKTKEIEIELLLTEKPVKEAELKKLVTELFDIVQKRLRVHAADLDLEAKELKKRIEERDSLKDRIVDKRIQNLKDRQKQGQVGKTGDRLSWD